MDGRHDTAPRPALRNACRLTVALLVVIVTWWSTSGVAHAHTGLAASTPADGAVITEPLTEVRFEFTDAVEPFEAGFAFVIFDGSTLPIESISQPDPATVVVVPVQPIEVPVEARWAIVSGDSHPLTGSILVAVDVEVSSVASTTTTAPATSSSTTTTTSTSTTTAPPAVAGDASAGPDATAGASPAPGVDEQLEILRDRVDNADASLSPQVVAGVIRWVAYAATAVALGGTTLALAAAWKGTEAWRLMAGWLWAGVTVLALSTVLTVGGQLAELNDDAADLLSMRTWGDVFEGRFRAGVLVRLVGAAVVAIALLRPPTRRPWIFAIGAAAVIASYPILGHGDEGAGWLNTPATMLHVAAISVWVGGLAGVLLLSRRGSRSQFIGVTRIFSGLAGIALAATVVAGIALTVAQLDAASELYSSDYGRRLLVKIGLVAGVAGLGALHRYRTLPRLQTGATSTAVFVRLAALEMAGFAAVLATTVWLALGAS